MSGSPKNYQTLWDVAVALEDTLCELERAQKAAYIFLEDITDEFLSPQSYLSSCEKSRLEDYMDGLYLAENHAFNERAHLEKLKNKLFELGREQKKAEETRKEFNNSKRIEKGASV